MMQRLEEALSRRRHGQNCCIAVSPLLIRFKHAEQEEKENKMPNLALSRC
jgi:hypothetical protein